ncbi:hypothetical protein J19TS2_22050 [Cohnella xylanilytica]|uniref:response regulator n=1 Tax=Cohnella xylanilytica TaxID=557555 RepID=UPI001B295307|nr:response regulator [Cohnella xylanilytica]GIO12650.1 hypothetical protein J19TS2_22050 [Cohnella xylanilytica]
MKPMLKLCVIDDIRSVVDMIRTKIPWAEHGIEVAGSATDGEAGLAVIREAKPELVVTDIRMPKMDGLEMTRRIMELLPGSKIIILSAYTDFEYARKAIEYGAFHYVTKPFSADDIVRIVLKAKEAWEADNAGRLRVMELEKRMKESLSALRQEYLSLLVHHPTAEADSSEWWDLLRLKPVRPPLAVMVIQIDPPAEGFAALSLKELELVRFSLQNIVEETIGAFADAVVFRDEFYRYVCLLDASGAEDGPLGIADACCANIARYTKFTISIGIGRTVGDVRELPRGYREAIEALAHHFYTGGNGAVLYRSESDKGPGDWIYSAEGESEFLFAFRSGNLDKCSLWLSRVFGEMEGASGRPDPGYAKHLFQGLALRMLRIMLEKFPREAIEDFEAGVEAKRPADPADLREYRRWLFGLCELGCGRMNSERASESRKIIFRSMEYIRAHLHMDLTLEHCARQVNLSWGYYSNLFKKASGMTFQQFVTQERIERAKAMLLEDFQVQEIAQSLGYEHRRYFSDVFKKQTGMTPTEFKESYLGKRE